MMSRNRKHSSVLRPLRGRGYQEGKWGYILAWLLGIPIPILLIVFLLRGCT